MPYGEASATSEMDSPVSKCASSGAWDSSDLAALKAELQALDHFQDWPARRRECMGVNSDEGLGI